MICKIFNINVKKNNLPIQIIKERKKRSIHIFVSKIKIKACYSQCLLFHNKIWKIKSYFYYY